jgi:hypothetical protein
MYLSCYPLQDQTTYLLPLREPGGIAYLAVIGDISTETLKKIKTAAMIPQRASSIVSKSLYAYTLVSTLRNLYRIPLQ